MRTADDIVALFYERRKAAGVTHQRMRDITALYSGDLAIPLPEMAKDEPVAVINYAKMGINHLAMRAGSVTPQVAYVAAGASDLARKRADDRRRVNHGWWGAQRMNLLLRQRYRWLWAYATAPVLIRPLFKGWDQPVWQLRSPLDTFPSAPTSVTDFTPRDVIFAQARDVAWLRATYPDAASMPAFEKAKGDDLVEVLEYSDHEQFHVVAALRPRPYMDMIAQVSSPGGASSFISEPAPAGLSLLKVGNRAGRAWAVIPRSIALERPVGHFDGMVPMHLSAARLKALGMLAKERGVFQETWVVSSSSDEPEIITVANPRDGTVGKVRGGVIDRASPHPQFATDNYLDRLEREQRVEAGVPASFGGEAASNVRTGRLQNGLMEASVDPLVMEAQEIIVAGLEEENRLAVDIDRAYWAGQRKTVAVNFAGDTSEVTYDPAKLWETSNHKVRYPLPGADIHGVNIATGQAVGMGVMSKRTAATLNPLIENPEAELDAVVAEQVDAMLMQKLAADAMDPQSGMSVVQLARFQKLVREDRMSIADAVLEIQRLAQAEQAQPPATPEEMQPGIVGPGELPPSIGPTDDQQGLLSLLGSLTIPQQALATANRA